MGSSVPLRTDFDATGLRVLARKSGDNRQIRRLLALAAVYDGMNRTAAAKAGRMDRQTLRDWVQELARIVEAGPDPQIDGVVRWRQIDLVRIIKEHFGVVCSDSAVANYQSELDFFLHFRPPSVSRAGSKDHRWVQRNFTRTLAAHVAHLPKGKPIELWFQDEARIGQKNGRTRFWARKGTRPRLPADQRYKNTYLFGAICQSVV
jgi:transposase